MPVPSEGLCGVAPNIQDSSAFSGNIFPFSDLVIDRFGNPYTVKQITVNGNVSISHIVNTENCGCDEFIGEGIDPGIFQAVFEDCSYLTNAGFADATYGSKEDEFCALF